MPLMNDRVSFGGRPRRLDSGGISPLRILHSASVKSLRLDTASFESAVLNQLPGSASMDLITL